MNTRDKLQEAVRKWKRACRKDFGTVSRCAMDVCVAAENYLAKNQEKLCDKQKQRIEELEKELEGLRGWKRSVDEALNSGDGTYRP